MQIKNQPIFVGILILGIFFGGCASPQNTPVDLNQAVTAYIALDNLDSNVDSLEVLVKPNTDKDKFWVVQLEMDYSGSGLELLSFDEILSART